MNSVGPTPYEYLTDVLVEKFEVDRADIAETATFSDLDLDSLAVVELFVTLSDQWRVALDDSEAVPGLTLAATAALVDRALQDQAA
ncbi:phosphopantetheine-binding protein [Streptomyces sp. S.PB5]|nr:phosphopantetheine-binding protein [Streptomyces sp. S.PB5]MDN3020981.1 phosphopantetheine-binding protein [Streptomyces sp. S.PB5]